MTRSSSLLFLGKALASAQSELQQLKAEQAAEARSYARRIALLQEKILGIQRAQAEKGSALETLQRKIAHRPTSGFSRLALAKDLLRSAGHRYYCDKRVDSYSLKPHIGVRSTTPLGKQLASLADKVTSSIHGGPRLGRFTFGGIPLPGDTRRFLVRRYIFHVSQGK